MGCYPIEPAPHRRILVPLDGSETAEGVLPYVVGLIRPAETHIHLLSVLTAGWGEQTVALMSSYPPGLRVSTIALSRAQASLEEYLRRVASRMRGHGASVSHEVRQGNPAEEILDCIAEIGADLVVMNTHGLSGVSRWAYGSVTDRVLRNAPCPVLLIRTK